MKEVKKAYIQMKYKNFEISNISVSLSHWNREEIEISFGSSSFSTHWNFVPYIPDKHDELFSNEATLEKKWEVLKDDIIRIIDGSPMPYKVPNRRNIDILKPDPIQYNGRNFDFEDGVLLID